MPYIELQDKEFWAIIMRDFMLDIENKHRVTVGEINYILTNILLAYLHKQGVSYHTLNDIDGILGCVQKEFYRRVTVPYEEQKRKENGDVFKVD